MGSKGETLLEFEEDEIRNLFMGIMEGYKDTVIPPFSKFSPISISENGPNSRKGDDEEQESIWAENILKVKERKRRKQMNDRFSILHSMVPGLFEIYKPPREKIIDETVKFINSLEEEIRRLESLRKQPWHESREAKKQVLSKGTNQNSSVNVTLISKATFLAIEVPFRPGLMTDIIYVLDKHQTEILEARVSVDNRNLLTFAATLMVPNHHGCDIAIQKMKEELLSL
ncbi:basic helix-loop-helix protein A-like [Primulina tabacum]|uniref:basic helix-loop-helix protein A-like n=1 Tax=Primulina tabacum TaxID=48773 RepID=UPI003F5ABE96